MGHPGRLRGGCRRPRAVEERVRTGV